MEEQRSAQLAAIVAASGDAIISIGTDLAVQTWNAGAQRLLGYSEGEAIGRSIVELIIPDAYEAERSAIYAAAMSSRTAVLKETVRLHKDGRLLPVETNISPILDGAGNVTGFSIILRDISERRRAEDALQQHAERQALLLEITSDLIRAAGPSELSRLTFQRIGPALGADICTNFRFEPGGQHLRLEFQSGIPAELSEAVQLLELGQAYCGMAAASRQPVVADKRRIACDPDCALVRTLGATAYACHPLMASDGRLLGTFAVASRTRESFTDDEIAWLGTVINFLGQIWERLEAERGLCASEERLRLAQDAAGLGHWDFDFARDTLIWSQQARKLIGVGPAEPASLALLLSRVHAEDRRNVEHQIARSYSPDSDHVRRVEFRVVTENGDLRWLEEQGRVEMDAAGKPIRALGVIRDITERKQTEARLAEREAQLALFVEHAPAAIAMFDTDMVCVAASRRFLSDHRVPENVKVIGVSLYEAFPEIPPRWREVHRRVLAGEELAADEDPFLRPDGRTDWCRWSMKPWRIPNGRIGGALLFSEVITEQVEARRALTYSEGRFRATFENAAVGIAHLAPDGRWLRVNEALSRIVGYPADELITMSFQDITHPDDLAADLAEVKNMLDGKIDSYGRDKRYLRKDGSIVWGRLTVGGVRKSDGSIDYFVSVVEDISARKQAEQELQTTKDRLQLALDAALLGWWQYDPQHRTFWWDVRSRKIVGIVEDKMGIEEFINRVHPNDIERVLATLEATLDPANPKPYATEYRIRLAVGEVRWVEAHGLAHFAGIGGERRAVSLVGTAHDITERKQREEKEHLLIREINHRAKNMLSVVEAIAHQTAAKNPEDFIERFSERIQALSANQDLLVRSEWKGVDIDDLVHTQLAHFIDLIGSRIAVQGPKLRLNPASVQAIGLALHELSTNAAKYGALSTDRGCVDISWGSDGDTLTMSWIERNGPVSPPERCGFGTIVMEAMVERSVGGEVEIDYAPSGVTWRLTCPAANALERR
jgi:PAS domain S-box-containing protein